MTFFLRCVLPDIGEVEQDSNIITDNSPARAKANGIAAIYQQPALFPELAVAENISIGLEGAGSWRRIDWKQRRQRALDLLEQVGSKIDPDWEVRDLSMPEQFGIIANRLCDSELLWRSPESAVRSPLRISLHCGESC